MKRYVLGNCELSLPDIYLLSKCIEIHIEELDNFMVSDFCSKRLFELYRIELNRLNLLLKELESYGD